LNSVIFETIYNSWKNGFDDGTSYGYYAEKFNLLNAESVRSSFRRERKRRGISKDDKISEVPVLGKNLSPRVGVIDCETLPAVVYTFSLWDQNIGIEQIISDISLLSWAGKYLNESKIYSDILTKEEAPEKSDRRIAQSCWNFVSTCDVIIGHNWSGFDGRILNNLFLQYNLPPLKYVTVDTLAIAKQSFRWTSNKLAFINDKLGIRNKYTNEGFTLWRKCHEGNQEALDEMLKYNIGDILATESLFYRVRPYVKNFNVSLYNEIEEYQCPVCGSIELESEGFYYTSAGKYESVRCQKCDCISRKKENLLTKNKRKNLLINS
jgi:hypothetical protein